MPLKRGLQLIIQNSKEFGIDLNAKNKYGRTALNLVLALLESPKPWHNSKGQATTVQMILKNWKEVDIDIKANGKAVLDFINFRTK